MSLLWRIKSWWQDKYLKCVYENECPEITYDDVLHAYVHPNVDGFCSYIEDIAEELCGSCLCYEFQIGGEYSHHHEFQFVVEDAYNYGSQFSVPPECESDYSKQELELLRTLAIKGEQDRSEYRREHGLDSITMSSESEEGVVI